LRSSKIWAIRMPGGPTKILRSTTRLIREDDAKKIYKDSFRHKSTEVDSDPDTVWPLLEPLTETELTKYQTFIENSEITGKPRALIEV
jgi:hypothetical protein